MVADRLAPLWLLAVVCVATPLPSQAAVDVRPAVQAILDGVSREALEPVVADLSGETEAIVGGEPFTFTTRSSSSGESIDRVEQYVYEHLESYGLDAVEYMEFPGEMGAPPGRNVIGQIDGTTRADEIIIVGAHMDSYPWVGPAPGADDDASGVSATLYLARAFAPYVFERTVRFAFFGDEENAPWMCEEIGSAGYAARCAEAGEDVVAMIQADSIAYDPPETDEQIVEMNTRRPEADPGGGDAAIAALWLEVIDAYALSDLAPRELPIGDNWSDHGSFWNEGYNAAMLIEEEMANANPNWHTANDRISTFDWPFYAQVTRSYAAVTAHLAGIEAGAGDTGADPDDTGGSGPDDTGDGRPHRHDTGTGDDGGCGCGVGAGRGGALALLAVSALLACRRRRRPAWPSGGCP